MLCAVRQILKILFLPLALRSIKLIKILFIYVPIDRFVSKKSYNKVSRNTGKLDSVACEQQRRSLLSTFVILFLKSII